MRYLKYCAWMMLLSVSCDSSDEPVAIETTSDYQPLRPGMFILYDVSETRYELGDAATSQYELKTVVADSFLNGSGTFSYIIHRSIRQENEASWTYLDTWSARSDEQEALVQEDNTSFIKFRLPITDGLEWNGNSYNNGEEDVYIMEDTHATHTYGGKAFVDCITVNQNDNDDHVVFLDERKEIYARNVGLIYKETTQLHYCTQEELDCIGQQIVEEGVIYTQTIKDHGME